MDIPTILNYLYPNSQWVLNGENYNGLLWISLDEKPTEEELLLQWPLVKNILLNKQIESNRKIAFQLEADPLFFGWQRGENTQQEWIDKVEEIRQRYPYIELNGDN